MAGAMGKLMLPYFAGWNAKLHYSKGGECDNIQENYMLHIHTHNYILSCEYNLSFTNAPQGMLT